MKQTMLLTKTDLKDCDDSELCDLYSEVKGLDGLRTMALSGLFHEIDLGTPSDAAVESLKYGFLIADYAFTAVTSEMYERFAANNSTAWNENRALMMKIQELEQQLANRKTSVVEVSGNNKRTSRSAAAGV